MPERYNERQRSSALHLSEGRGVLPRMDANIAERSSSVNDGAGESSCNQFGASVSYSMSIRTDSYVTVDYPAVDGLDPTGAKAVASLASLSSSS